MKGSAPGSAGIALLLCLGLVEACSTSEADGASGPAEEPLANNSQDYQREPTDSRNDARSPGSVMETSDGRPEPGGPGRDEVLPALGTERSDAAAPAPNTPAPNLDASSSMPSIPDAGRPDRADSGSPLVEAGKEECSTGSPDTEPPCSDDFHSVASGDDFACALLDEQIVCWGQLPPGIAADQPDVSRLTRVWEGQRWQDLSAQSDRLCGHRDDQLYCMADAGSGAATQVGGAGSWRSVSLTASKACAVYEGQLLCWGSGFDGMLGLDAAPAESPARIGTASDWLAVNIDEGQGCGIREGDAGAGGKLYCWNAASRAPRQVGDAADWRSIAVKAGNACGVRGYPRCPAEDCEVEGGLYCWGERPDGPLGLAEVPEDTSEPLRVDAEYSYRYVTLQRNFGCALRDSPDLSEMEEASGSYVYCWGELPPAPLELTPTRVSHDLLWILAGAGNSHLCLEVNAIDYGDPTAECLGSGPVGTYVAGTDGAPSVETVPVRF
jgi:hypothetical protein